MARPHPATGYGGGDMNNRRGIMFFHPDLATQFMWYRLLQPAGDDDDEGEGEE